MNSYGGDDTLAGGTGNDELWGDAMGGLVGGEGGADSFVFDFEEGFGEDVIHDFEDGLGADCDVLVFESAANTNGGSLDASDLDSAGHTVSDAGVDSDVILTFVGGDSILIVGIGDGTLNSFVALDAAINIELYL